MIRASKPLPEGNRRRIDSGVTPATQRAGGGSLSQAALCAAVAVACLLLAFAPRGSRTLGYLSENSTLVALGTLVKPVPSAHGGVAWRFSVDRTLKGKTPGRRLSVWIPPFEPLRPFTAGEQVVLFLSPVPDRTPFRHLKAVGKGLWRIQGGESGVIAPLLLPAVEEMVAALSRGDRDALVALLIRQAGDARVRVREDAAADLGRLCPAGCPLDAPNRARLMELARKAHPESAYRKSLLCAAGERARQTPGEEAP